MARTRFFFFFLILCLFLASAKAQDTQPFQRLRYQQPLRWQVWHGKGFHLYYPHGCDSIARFVSAAFLPAQTHIRKALNASAGKEPQIILYPSLTRLYESNIGSTAVAPLTLPTLVSKGNRVLLAYRGDTALLETDLRLALARSVWEEWFREGVTEQIRSNWQQSEIPEWYREGVIRYAALGWRYEDEQHLTSLLQQQGRQQVATEEPAIWGAAFCYYLSRHYYPQAPQQLLFQVRKKKSLARGTRLVTKRLLPEVDSACADFYRSRYRGTTLPAPDSLRSQGRLRQQLYATDSSHRAVVIEKDQRRELWLKPSVKEKAKRIARYPLPPWISDYAADPYPVLCFSPEGTLLAAAPYKGKLEVKVYNTNGLVTERRVLRPVEGLDHLEVNDRRDWLLHAWRMGRSDLVHYDPQRERYRVADRDSTAVYQQASEPEKADTANSPWHREQREEQARKAAEDSTLNAARDTTTSFLSGALGGGNRKNPDKDSLRFDSKKAQPYILQLYSAYFSAQVNNDYYINRYQPYQNYQGQFKFPEAGAQAKGGFTDLFENHHFSIAYRLPAGSDGSDFFTSYRNTARRTAWGLTYFRKVEQLSPDPLRNWTGPDSRLYPNAGKVKTHYYELSLAHPLSWYSVVDFSTALRYDRTIFTATDLYSLRAEDLKATWSVSTLAYALDKRRLTLPGLYKGFYAQAGIDAFSSVKGEGGTTFGPSAKLEYHRPLYKGITLAARLQGGYNAGTGRILYNFGGTDGNLAIRVDSDVHFKQDAPYVFQTLVTPFRGYRQNSLYGDRYALLNLDVYVPLFAGLIDLKTPLPSINNLQLGVFTDIAGASENYKGAVKNDRDEWLYSIGFSARTILAGYPIRFDMAWPGTGGKPVWYLNLKL